MSTRIPTPPSMKSSNCWVRHARKCLRGGRWCPEYLQFPRCHHWEHPAFQKDYDEVKVVKLEQNYRSTKNILHVANEVIGNNKNQIEKNSSPITCRRKDTPGADHDRQRRRQNRCRCHPGNKNCAIIISIKILPFYTAPMHKAAALKKHCAAWGLPTAFTGASASTSEKEVKIFSLT